MVEAVLVTGGAGYIGSHTCIALQAAGYEVVILDNFSNSSPIALERIGKISGISPRLVQGDVRDQAVLDRVLAGHAIAAVIHFAGLKAVGESVAQPLRYYDNNVNGTIALLAAMQKAGVKTLVFSSSATVYGNPATIPVREDAPRSANSPYGRSKIIIEDVLADFCQSQPDWNIARLRYFNPVGAHPSGLIGEDPRGIPNNLMPYITQVAIGRREKLYIYGADYPTRDGTGVRDYIHVSDLAEGHVAALDFCRERAGMLTVNLGTGKGSSVLEMVEAFEKISGRQVPYEIVARRSGDVAECWADPTLALKELHWQARRGLTEMCADSWRWQQANPEGYR